MGKRSLNGFSVAWGGLSWDNNITSKEYFEKLLFYLESKRILVNPFSMEEKTQCIESVLEIKHFLTELPIEVEFTKEERDFLRTMIRACNCYLDNVKKRSVPRILYQDENRWTDVAFDKAMKEFRSSFRDTIKLIENRYHLHFDNTIFEED